MANDIVVTVRGEDKTSGAFSASKKGAKDLTDGFDKAGEAADNVDTKAMGFRDTLTGVQDTMKGASKIAKGDLFNGFLTLGMGIGDLGSGLYNFVIPTIKAMSVSMIKNAIATVRSTVASTAHRVASIAAAVGMRIMTVAQKALNMAMRANPIGIVITVLALLVGALIYAYKHSETFRRIVQAAWRGIQNAARYAWENVIKPVFRFLVRAFNLYVDSAIAAGKFLRRVWDSIVDKVRDAVARIKDRFGNMVDFVRGVPGKISNAFRNAGRLLYNKGKQIIDGLKDGFLEKWHKLQDWVKGIAKWIKDHKGPVSMDADLLKPAGKALMGGLLHGLKMGFKGVGSFVYGVAGSVHKVISSIKSSLGGIGSGVEGMPTDISGNAALVLSAASRRGWNGIQGAALYQLVQHESGFRNTAQNPTSSAYGMFQFLNSTWGGVGGHKTSDPRLQTAYGLEYIARAYGTPLNAWNKWQSRSPHWYGKGGWINEPVMGVGMKTGDTYGFGEKGSEYVSPNGAGITVNVATNANPYQIGRELAWVMKTSGR